MDIRSPENEDKEFMWGTSMTDKMGKYSIMDKGNLEALIKRKMIQPTATLPANDEYCVRYDTESQ